MEIAYGHRVESVDDEYIHIAECAGKETVESGNAGSMLVDFFPTLQYLPIWFPGAGFKRKAAEVKKVVQKMFDMPFEMVRNAMASGTASPCFTASLLDEVLRQGSLSKEYEDDIKSAAGVLYGAATDTTVVILSTFILAMLLHPEVCQKAQAEIDRTVGTERLPDFDDREALPYLECVIREVFRWNCPVPLGIPHRTIQPDEYRGYNIPADSMVIANIWAMTRDEASYPQPEVFRPERFLEMDHQALQLLDPRNIAFGFGRRVCPGQQFADSSIWLAVAHLVATVNITKVTGKDGKPLTPAAEFVPGFVSHPKDFTCIITPRSGKVVQLVSDLRDMSA
ncbi:hypothetical protein EVJ58_g1910 [Rhodofomes roseus]|nr:hypothetical protein EVJ58_g1910 [Rhodofomes roseus]